MREEPPHASNKQPHRGNLTYHSPPYGGGAGGGATVLILHFLHFFIHQQALSWLRLNGEWLKSLHTDNEEIGIAIERWVVAHVHKGWIEHLRTIAVMTVVGEVAHNH